MNGNEPSLIRAIRGPITLITVGVLFALNNFTQYGFGQTWPVLLIVFGLLSLLRRGTEQVPPQDPSQPWPPYGYPPPPNPSGSYAQSTYVAPPPPPVVPAKGGFGASAPPRSNDPEQTPPAGGSL